jgi:hypothetical protein
MAGKRKKITYVVTEAGCFECTSHYHYIGTSGYPCVWKDGRNQNLHKVLYEEKFGKLPKGMLVRHKCDNTKCINMRHCIRGTVLDNARDRDSRGRGNPPRGERSGTAKLTEEQVRLILKSPSTTRELAEKFGVTPLHISAIKSHRRWAHVR